MQINKESQLRSESARGAKAAELLSNELLIEAFDVIDKRLTDAWKNLPDGKEKDLTKLWITQKLLQSLKGFIEEVAQTGKMASLQLEQDRTMMQRAKEWASETF